jgi:hypothetical protein
MLTACLAAVTIALASLFASATPAEAWAKVRYTRCVYLQTKSNILPRKLSYDTRYSCRSNAFGKTYHLYDQKTVWRNR